VQSPRVRLIGFGIETENVANPGDSQIPTRGGIGVGSRNQNVGVVVHAIGGKTDIFINAVLLEAHDVHPVFTGAIGFAPVGPVAV